MPEVWRVRRDQKAVPDSDKLRTHRAWMVQRRILAADREDLPLRVYVEAPEQEVDMLFAAVAYTIEAGNIPFARELQFGHLPVSPEQSVLMAYELSDGFDEVWIFMDTEADRGMHMAVSVATDKGLTRRFFTTTPGHTRPFVEIGVQVG